jgi:hypothetical protein
MDSQLTSQDTPDANFRLADHPEVNDGTVNRGRLAEQYRIWLEKGSSGVQC